MVSFIHSNDFITYIGSTIYGTKTIALCVANVTTLGRTNSITDFVSAEITSTPYSRATGSFTAGTYDTGSDQRYEMPNVSLVFSPTGGAIQFQTVFTILGGSTTGSKNFAPSNIDTSTDIITINNHGYANGDKLIFTPDNSSTLPSGISASTQYTVNNVTTNTFKLTGVDITTTGTGTFRARNVNGQLLSYYVEPSPVTLNDGDSRTYLLSSAILNTGYVTGV